MWYTRKLLVLLTSALLLQALFVQAQSVSDKPIAFADRTAEKRAQARDSSLIQKTELLLNKEKLTGLSSQTFAKFFQLAYDRGLLTQEKSTFTLKGTLYAFSKLDKNYSEVSTKPDGPIWRQKLLRHTAIQLGAEVGEGTKLTDGVWGVEWAAINKQDPFFHSQELAQEFKDLDSASTSLDQGVADFREYLRQQPVEKQQELQKEFDAAEKTDDATVGTSGISKAKMELLKKYGFVVSVYNVEKMADRLKNRPLLKLYAKGSFDFKMVSGFTYTQGTAAGSPTPWTLVVDGFHSYADTTVMDGSQKKIYYRSMITSKLGFNKVLLTSGNNNSPLMEVGTKAGYNLLLNSTVPSDPTPKDKFYFESVLRIRISSEVWVPLTVQYDPKHSNFLGYMKVIWSI